MTPSHDVALAAWLGTSHWDNDWDDCFAAPEPKDAVPRREGEARSAIDQDLSSGGGQEDG